MARTPIITGLHHVTAFAKDPRENHHFYTSVLGLRLVKKTVNFDDPLTYHLYYGDAVGSPGTLLTHFPQPSAARTRHGGSEITEIALAVPNGSLLRWRDRLTKAAVTVVEGSLAGRACVRFGDPDDMRYAFVESEATAASAATDAAAGDAIIAVERAIISVPDAEQTASFLVNVLGFAVAQVSGPEHHLTLAGGGIGQRLTLLDEPNAVRQPMGAGTIHHIAWRVPDDAAQRRVADVLRAAGVAPTQVMDRQYFRSIYFRIPTPVRGNSRGGGQGGVLFEIATDGPGFDVDEPRESLGTALKLPPQHEPKRSEIERRLVAL